MHRNPLICAFRLGSFTPANEKPKSSSRRLPCRTVPSAAAHIWWPQTGETPKGRQLPKGGGRLLAAKSIITNRQHGASHVRQHQPTARGLVNINSHDDLDLSLSLPVCSSVSAESDYKRADKRLFSAVPCLTLSASKSNNARRTQIAQSLFIDEFESNIPTAICCNKSLTRQSGH